MMVPAYNCLIQKYRLLEQISQMVRSFIYVLPVQITQVQDKKILSWFKNQYQAASQVYQRFQQDYIKFHLQILTN